MVLIGAERLVHDSLGLSSNRYDLEVWSDPPQPGSVPAVVLYVEPRNGESCYPEMTPTEARALAALLVKAAETQERRAAS